MQDSLASALGKILVGALFLAILAAASLILLTGRPYSFEISGLSAALAAGWLIVLALLVRSGGNLTWRCVAAWATLAVGLRLVAALAIGGFEGVAMGNDYSAYLQLATGLLRGDGLLAHTMNYGWVRGMYPPLYPLLLAGAGSALGIGPTTVLLVNSVLDLGSAGLLYCMGRRFEAREAGIVAAGLFLTWPSFILAAPLPQKESLVVFLALLQALLMLKAVQEGPKWGNAAAFGIVTALASLAQPIMLAFAPCLALALLPRIGLKALMRFGLSALPFLLLAMLPWWVRNWLLFGEFVPFTTTVGPSMMIAASGHQLPLAPDLLALGEPARSSAQASKALAMIAADPAGFVWRSFNAMAPAMAREQYDAVRITRFQPPVGWAISVLPAMTISYSVTAGLALRTAMRSGERDGPRLALLLVLACLLLIGLFGIWFQFAERHRDFMTPMLIMLASFSIAGAERDQGLVDRA